VLLDVEVVVLVVLLVAVLVVLLVVEDDARPQRPYSGWQPVPQKLASPPQ
jgi:hypothetical protein